MQDLRHALRHLRKSPVFATVAVLTLALGIGANTAIFSVVNSVLLKPLRYRDPGRLYLIQEIVPQMRKFYPSMPANVPDFRIWQRDCHSFEEIAIAESASADMTGLGEPEQIHGVRASANIFNVLGTEPQMGRGFLPSEDDSGHGRVVVLTNEFWRSQFGGDRNIVGRSITLDGSAYLVAGVLSASFHFPRQLGQLTNFGERVDFFEPLNGLKDDEQGLIGEFDFAAIGRLKPGVTREQALAELNVVQAQIAKTANVGLDLQASIVPLNDEVVGAVRHGLILLLAAVAAVLLIACVNIANLLLARVPNRTREEGIRVALGAPRWRLFQRALTESMVLAIGGGILGAFVGRFALLGLIHAAPAGLPRLDEVHIDATVFLFTLLLSLLTAALFGALPALRMANSDPLDALRSGTAGSGENWRARRMRSTLIALEVGLSTLLLIVAGLLTSSLGHLLHINTGFATENVWAADVDLPPNQYSDAPKRLHFYNAALDRIRALPGVSATGWVSILPLHGEGAVSGINVPPGNQALAQPIANYRTMSPGYLKVMGIPLVRGRVFNESDRGRKVVVISESVAQRFWPGEDPIGHTVLAHWGPQRPEEVIGVVGDIHTVKLDAPPIMMVYVPDWYREDSAPHSASIVVRASADEPGISAAIREAIHSTDPEVPIVALESMKKIVSASVAPRRFQMSLLLLFAGCALFLASLGIYGVIAYSVAQRRQELGIRSALGARVSDLQRMVLRQGMTPVLAGLIGGILAAIATGRLVESLLFGVRPLDATVLGIVTILVLTVALVACYLPARNAAKVDPTVALRYE
jgi:predicted permease